MEIYKPVFIIGCPRSGTDICYQLLRLHPDMAWITPVTSRAFAKDSCFFETPGTAKFIQFLVDRIIPEKLLPAYKGPVQSFDGSLKVKGIPETNEGYRIWNAYRREDRHYMTEHDLTDEAREYFRWVVRAHLKLFNRPRFVNKFPRNSMRIRHLNDIFPDALFINVVRDGRAVANSIQTMKERTGNADGWWGAKPPDWEKIRKQHRDPIVQTGMQWKSILNTIERDAAEVLNKNRYYMLKYEDLTSSPEKQTKKMLRFLELNPDRFPFRERREYIEKIESRNGKWKKIRTKAEKMKLEKTIGGKLAELGYARRHH